MWAACKTVDLFTAVLCCAVLCSAVQSNAATQCSAVIPCSCPHALCDDPPHCPPPSLISQRKRKDLVDSWVRDRRQFLVDTEALLKVGGGQKEEGGEGLEKNSWGLVWDDGGAETLFI